MNSNVPPANSGIAADIHAPRRKLSGWPLYRCYLIGFGLLAALIAVNHFAFAFWTQTTYLTWYIENGKWASLGTSMLGLVWTDLNKRQELISQNPVLYLRECSWMVGLTIFSAGTPLKAKHDDAGFNALDGILATIFCLLASAFLVAWFVVVVPLQYFVHLIAGAPARFFLASQWRTVVSPPTDGQIVATEMHVSSPLPEGWRQATWVEKPVSTTSLIAFPLLELCKVLFVPAK